jgi:hypothetical protein
MPESERLLKYHNMIRPTLKSGARKELEVHEKIIAIITPFTSMMPERNKRILFW